MLCARLAWTRKLFLPKAETSFNSIFFLNKKILFSLNCTTRSELPFFMSTMILTALSRQTSFYSKEYCVSKIVHIYVLNLSCYKERGFVERENSFDMWYPHMGHNIEEIYIWWTPYVLSVCYEYLLPEDVAGLAVVADVEAGVEPPAPEQYDN